MAAKKKGPLGKSEPPPTPATKTCSKCGETKPVGEFRRQFRFYSQQSTCGDCWAKDLHGIPNGKMWNLSWRLYRCFVPEKILRQPFFIACLIAGLKVEDVARISGYCRRNLFKDLHDREFQNDLEWVKNNSIPEGHRYCPCCLEIRADSSFRSKGRQCRKCQTRKTSGRRIKKIFERVAYTVMQLKQIAKELTDECDDPSK